ncbi:nuclease-related domain-containing protein [Nocardia suismassiliense]|uniref:nuclease-related domain-containing protein n=1 Tax=Nocardia suismassiliense TaxID=2077092 RepID=UPI000D1FBDC5|nr:nuclease-related domain-containing protein [Nocardia suismassiliense]
MLVINGERRRMTYTERTTVAWLKSWRDIGGVAISGCYVDDRNDPSDATDGDIVLLTPQGCIVIEVKRILELVSGRVSCRANGPWSMPGVTGSPVHTRKGDLNPIDQVSDGTYNLKNLAASRGIDTFVVGLVLLFGQKGCTIEVRTAALPRGIEVLAAHESHLRNWLHRKAQRSTTWSAQQAHTLLTALNFAGGISLADLVAEGFPDIPLAGVVDPQQEGGSTKLGMMASPERAHNPFWFSIPPRVVDTTVAPVRIEHAPTPSLAVIYRRPPRRHGAQRLGAIGLIVILAATSMLFIRWHNETTSPPAVVDETTLSTTPTPTIPSPDAHPVVPSPDPTPAEAAIPISPPPARKYCYPFQIGC